MIMGVEELNRVEELKHREELLFNIVDKLQCYFGDNLRLIDYLKEQCGFTTDDISKILLLGDD